MAVETGWQRARRTILAADFVSFLAAVVLYVLSVGGVRGFAFTLGLTTLVDIVVVFLFTKPLVTMLAKTNFFGGRPQVVRAGPRAPRRQEAQHDDAIVPPGRCRRRYRDQHRQGGLMSRLGTLGARLYRGEVSYDFIAHRKVWYGVSAVLLLVSIVSLLTVQLTLGIEFRGGAEFRVKSPSVTQDAVRSTVSGVVDTEIVVQSVGPDTVRVQTETLTTDEAEEVRNALAEEFGVSRESVSTQVIGPSWGKDISEKALRALVFFLIGVVVFLSLYFEWKMALAAMVALLHDLVITVGIYSLIGFEVTPATVIGFLTILGYSLYDTVVVFDKVRENTAGLAGGSRMTYSERREPRGQPDPGAIDQHLDHRAAADRRDPVRRSRAAGRGAAQGPVARAVHRCGRRRVLVDLHRPAAARDLKEREPAMQALAKRVAGRRAGTGVEAPSARRKAAAAQPATTDQGVADTEVDDPAAVPAGAGAARKPAPPRRPAGGSQRSQPRKGSGGRNKSKKRR